MRLAAVVLALAFAVQAQTNKVSGTNTALVKTNRPAARTMTVAEQQQYLKWREGYFKFCQVTNEIGYRQKIDASIKREFELANQEKIRAELNRDQNYYKTYTEKLHELHLKMEDNRLSVEVLKFQESELRTKFGFNRALK